MKTAFQSIKGTFDILPDEYVADGTTIFGSSSWNFVESRLRETFQRFGMKEIRTPILEPTELIARGVGQLTDIVSKEMFAFERGDTNYVLRPEITAPVMRAYLEHHLDQKGGAQRLFYVGPCFRAERPQKGRYRQFHQFGCEIIGTPDPRADAEVIAAMMAVYRSFGILDTRLRLNSLGDAESRPRYREALKTYLEPYAGELSEVGRQRLQTNPLRILDTKDEKERRLLEGAPILSDYIDDESRHHFDQVKLLLGDLGVTFEEDALLVRGLDYYTRTAFELESANLGAQSALAGGGRYDLLAKEIGSEENVPAVGFAAGMERLFLALAAQNISFPERLDPDVFFVALGEEAERWAFKTANVFRAEGLSAGIDLKGRSMKAQMREANRQRARFAVIVGQDELTSGVAQVKNMQTGEQKNVTFSDLLSAMRAESERLLSSES